MALFPMERHMYSLVVEEEEDNCTNLFNLTFQPSARPPEDFTFTLLDVLGQSEYLLPLALQNMSLAALALMALREVSKDTSKGFLSPLTRFLRRVGLYLALMNLMKTLLGLVLLVAMVPIMMPPMVIFGVLSLLVRLYYALRWGSIVSKVEGMDAVWGVKNNSKPYITVCLKMHGVPDLASVQQAILTKVLQVRDSAGNYKYHKFRQLFLLRCGYYCWRDDPDFDINNHVREIQLSSLYPDAASDDSHEEDEDTANQDTQKEKSEGSDELLQRYMSEELVEGIPGDIPQWEVILAAGDDGRYNVLLRIHHAIGDGVTLVRLCVEALVDTPLPPLPVGAPPPNPFVRCAFMMWSMLMMPFGLKNLMVNNDRNCLHGAPLSGNNIMTWSKGMPLSVLRQVKNKASTTINDVLMSCLSAALAKHFSRRKEEVPMVTVVVPFSFHDLRKPLTLANVISIAAVKLPASKPLTPPARLSAVKEVLDDIKKDPTLWALHWVVKATSEVSPASVTSLMLSSHGLTLAASNVPGPQQEITMWGDKVEDIMFWVPNRDPVGVGVSFFSYKGVVKIGLNVDVALIPSRAEALRLLEDMEEELNVLHGRLLPQA